MTDYERMNAGLIYDPGNSELMAEQQKYQDKLWEFNNLRPSQEEEYARLIKEVFAEVGENTYIQRPVYANWGCRHVHLGSNIYANFNLTLVDDGHIYIGDWVQFGPNVTIATPGHPILPELRRHRNALLQYNKDVHIEAGVWVGAGAIILPGVTIGENSVIGAGSVVTRDIPANVVAVGNPCRVIREIGMHDRDYFFRGEQIDWNAINEMYPANKQ